MSPKLFSLCRFHFQGLIRAQPVAVAMAFVSVLAATIAGGLYAQQWVGADAAERELNSLNQQARAPVLAKGQANKVQIVLPVFNSSQLVDTLNRIASDTKLPLDEIVFSLDENANQPYLRYHATLTVTARYPVIRKFVDQVRSNVTEASLDNISCTREDIRTIDLTCDLAISVFYKKSGRG